MGTLTWQSAGTDEPGDQNADSALAETGCTSLYWSLGPSGHRWSVELIGVDHGDEVSRAGLALGEYENEAEAKAAAQTHEDTHH